MVSIQLPCSLSFWFQKNLICVSFSLADGFNPHSIFVDREGASSGRSTFDSINNSLSSSSSSSSCVQSSDSSRRPSYTVTKASLDPTGIDDTGHNDNLLPKKSHSPRGIHPIVGFSCLRILNLVKALQRTTQQVGMPYCSYLSYFVQLSPSPSPLFTPN